MSVFLFSSVVVFLALFVYLYLCFCISLFHCFSCVTVIVLSCFLCHFISCFIVLFSLSQCISSLSVPMYFQMSLHIFTGVAYFFKECVSLLMSFFSFKSLCVFFVLFCFCFVFCVYFSKCSPLVILLFFHCISVGVVVFLALCQSVSVFLCHCISLLESLYFVSLPQICLVGVSTYISVLNLHSRQRGARPSTKQKMKILGMIVFMYAYVRGLVVFCAALWALRSCDVL